MLITCSIYNTFLQKNQEIKKPMKSPIHKWVLNAMTGPNPTQYTKFAKHNENQPSPGWFALGNHIALAIIPSRAEYITPVLVVNATGDHGLTLGIFQRVICISHNL